MQRRRCARGLYPRGDSLRPYISCQHTPMAGEIRAVSAAAHRRKNCSTKKDACVGVFFDAFGCSGRGRGLPIVPHSRRRRRKRAYIQGAKAYFGVGESACGRGIDAACVCGRVLYGAVCIRTLCVQGRCWVFRPLRFTRRSVVAVSPVSPTFIRPAAWSADAKARHGGGI